MTQPRPVPLADVLSVTTEKLLSRRHMDGIYDLLRHMTGQGVYTHQLGMTVDVCGPALVEQHPFLAGLKPPDGLDKPDLMAWLVEAERIHGETVDVVPLSSWTRHDPIETLADAVGASKVWVVPMND